LRAQGTIDRSVGRVAFGDADRELADELALKLRAVANGSLTPVRPVRKRPAARIASTHTFDGGASDGIDGALIFAADALLSIAIEDGRVSRARVGAVVETLADVTGTSRVAASFSLYLRAIASPKLLELPPRLAIETHLRLLVALAPVSDVSLWIETLPGQVEIVASLGRSAATRRFRSVAGATIGGQTWETVDAKGRAQIHGLPVLRCDCAVGAVVVRSRPENRQRAAAFLRECTKMLAPVLERDLLLDRSTSRDQTLHSASERRLLRIGFDLHDGPLQEIAALAADLRLARDQLDGSLEGSLRAILLGRFDDLGGRLAEIDQSLRELSHSLESSSVVDRPLPDVLHREVESFDRRTGLRTRFEVSGNFDQLSASQRIALFRIVQEALSNIREHTVATQVAVSLEELPTGTRVCIRDNGGGFDVAQTVVSAARRGRLGLVGMNERVRLLGGTFSLQSAPGANTELTVTLPRWQPIQAAPAERPAAISS
jgi:signal transduction histidine kinase